MALTYTQNTILFSNIPDSGLTKVNYKPTANDFKYAEYGIKPFINMLEANWDGAQLKNGSTVKATLNTTGEMLSILQTAYNYATTYNVKYSGGKLYDDKGTEIQVGSTLSGATENTLGGIKTKYHTTGEAPIVNTSSVTAPDRHYGIETDGSYLGFVKVPWTDTKITVSDLSTSGNVLFLTGTTTRNNGGAVLTNLNTYNIGITTKGNLVKFDKGSTTSYKSFIHTINGISSINGDGTITITQVTNATKADKATTADTATNATNADKANTATTASKVANTLTVQFNGTTKATFNGSAASTINITPAAIGAAPKLHKTTDGSNGIADSDEYGHVKLETFVTTVEDDVNVSKDYSSYTGSALSLIGAETMFNKINENIEFAKKNLNENLNGKLNTKIRTVFDIYLGNVNTSFSSKFTCPKRTIGLSFSDVENAILHNSGMFDIPCYIAQGFSQSGSVGIQSDFANYTANGSIVFVNNTIKIPMGATWTQILFNHSNLPPLQVIIPTTQNTVAVTGIKLNKTTLSFSTLGATEQLTATVEPSNATNKTVTWKSGDISIATVSTSGVVTPKANGNTNITATCGGKTATCSVIVAIAATSLSVSSTSGTTIIEGPNGSVTLKATREPSNAAGTVSWASKNGAVYFLNGITTGDTVTVKGMATSSTATDVVIATLGSKTASCNITVNQGTITTLEIGADVASGDTIVSPNGQTIGMGINNVAANMWNSGGAPVTSDDITFDWEITEGNGATLSLGTNPVNVVSTGPTDTDTTTPTPTDTPTPSSSPEIVTKLENLNRGASVQLVLPANNTTSKKTYRVTVTANCLGKSKKKIYTVSVPGKVVETTYYWYAGQTEPTSMTSNPTPSSTFTCNNWFEIGTTLPTSVVQQVTGGASGKAWYAAMPTDAGLVAVTSADTTDTSITKEKTITINGVKYDVWYAGGVTASRFNLRFK